MMIQALGALQAETDAVEAERLAALITKTVIDYSSAVLWTRFQIAATIYAQFIGPQDERFIVFTKAEADQLAAMDDAPDLKAPVADEDMAAQLDLLHATLRDGDFLSFLPAADRERIEALAARMAELPDFQLYGIDGSTIFRTGILFAVRESLYEKAKAEGGDAVLARLNVWKNVTTERAYRLQIAGVPDAPRLAAPPTETNS